MSEWKRCLEESAAERVSRRKPGGSGWADAVFRTQADSGSYVRELFRRRQSRQGAADSNTRLMRDHRGSVFFRPGEVPVVLEDDGLEAMRRQSSDRFAQWLDETLRSD